MMNKLVKITLVALAAFVGVALSDSTSEAQAFDAMDMVAHSINANGSTSLDWDDDPQSINITEAEDVRVENSWGGTIYWWTGTSRPSTGGNQLANGSEYTFVQGESTVVYSYSNASTGAAQITLTLTGKPK